MDLFPARTLLLVQQLTTVSALPTTLPTYEEALGYLTSPYLERALLVLLLLPTARALVRTLLHEGVRGLYKKVAGVLLRAMQATVPGVAGIVDAQVNKELAGLERDMLGDGDAMAMVTMPERGASCDEVEAQMLELRGGELKKMARQWGGIYHDVDSELTRLQSRVWAAYNSTNALYPTVFPSLRKFESELVSSVVGIVHGHQCGAVGLLTSGGTESVLLAALAYREAGRKRGIERPQILCAVSAHPAILKACAYFGMELVKLPLDPATKRLTAATVAANLTARTVAIYASAPSFCHGVVDQIEELSALALKKGVGLHVDNCLGGFLLSYMSKEGLFTQPWDFALPGVTTMSVDVHKYGYAPKGASVVVFRDSEMRASTLVPSSDGCEGLYVTPTLQGSRSGAVMAAAWATLVHVGDDGYRRAAREISACHRRLKEEVATMEGLTLCADADLAIVAVCGEGGLNVYALASLLEDKGWGIFTGQKPPTLALPVGEQTPARLDAMLEDLRSCLAYLKANPNTKPNGAAAVYGAAAAIPDAVIDDILRGYIDIKMRVKPAAAAAGTAATATKTAAGKATKRAAKSPSRRAH